jgi:hypothetical protein
MNRDVLAIDPFRKTPEYDQDEARQLHHTLFGHYPPTDLNEKCDHPIHAQIRRDMNGAEHIILFDPDEIVSDDAVVQGMYDDRYQKTFDETKQWQGAIEEEIRHEEAAKLGIILPGKPY